MLRSTFGPTLGPLREGSYLRYFIAVTVSSAGSYASSIALAFGVLDVAGPAQLALIFLAREIPIVALVLAGGVFRGRGATVSCRPCLNACPSPAPPTFASTRSASATGA